MNTPQQKADVEKIIAMKKKGYTNGQIRDELNVSETTVSKHWKAYTDKNPSAKKNRAGNRGVK